MGQTCASNTTPWAILKVSCRQYEIAHPWKKIGITRQMFEKLLANLPEGFVDQLRLKANTKKLLRAILGEGD